MLVVDKPALTRLARALHRDAKAAGIEANYSTFLEAASVGLGFSGTEAASAHLRGRPLILSLGAYAGGIVADPSEGAIAGQLLRLFPADGFSEELGGVRDTATAARMLDMLVSIGIDGPVVEAAARWKEAPQWASMLPGPFDASVSEARAKLDDARVTHAWRGAPAELAAAEASLAAAMHFKERVSGLQNGSLVPGDRTYSATAAVDAVTTLLVRRLDPTQVSASKFDLATAWQDAVRTEILGIHGGRAPWSLRSEVREAERAQREALACDGYALVDVALAKFAAELVRSFKLETNAPAVPVMAMTSAGNSVIKPMSAEETASYLDGRPTRDGDVFLNGQLFAASESSLLALRAGLEQVGYRTKSDESGTISVSKDSERMSAIRCDGCGALSSASGAQRGGGHWCPNCGETVGMRVTAEEGSESLFEVSWPAPPVTRDGRDRRITATLKLVDYDPETKTVWLDRKSAKFDMDVPLGSQKVSMSTPAANELPPSMLRKAAKTRLVLGARLRHVEMERPVDTWQVSWPPAEHRDAHGVQVDLVRSRMTLRRFEEVSLYDGKVVDGKRRLPEFLHVVPSFHPRLPAGPHLMNRVLDKLQMASYSMLPDYVSRSGGWDPTVMSATNLKHVQQYVERFTQLNPAAFKEATSGSARAGHPAQSFLKLAKAFGDDTMVRMSYPGYGRTYHVRSLEKAEAWLEENLPKPEPMPDRYLRHRSPW